MKTEGINVFGVSKNLSFKGNRIFHNTVAQLAKNNPYSLTEPNQRAITNAIKELGNVKGIKNIRFLMDTAAKSAYSTNIKLQDSPKNDWVSKLVEAAKSALYKTGFNRVQTSYWLGAIAAITAAKTLNSDEKEILNLRDELLKAVNLEQIEKETVGTTKDFKRNLDYLIVSSETTLEHKKYILQRLNYFMSDDYEINPQLSDKKSIAVAEMVNDMAISVPNASIPNIKAVNQKQHGMCGAISIVRKKLAYEDKPNYVDSIISELDSTPYIEVYDRSKLGTGEKTKVAKVKVDFDAALKKGYRIIDASTMHWMQIGKMSGFSNISFEIYNSFDLENFDVKDDSFFNARFDNPDLEKAQVYYQALIKAENFINNYKADSIKKNISDRENLQNTRNNIEILGQSKKAISDILTKALPNYKNINVLSSDLVELQHKYSDQIKNEYEYIPNEEDIMKKAKIKSFIFSKTGEKLSDKDIESIFSLVDYYNSVQEKTHNSNPKTRMITKATSLYEIGAAYRYAILMSLEEDATLEGLMKDERIRDKETLISDTIEEIAASLYRGSQYEDLIIEHISKTAGVEIKNKDEAIEALVQLNNDFKEIMSGYIDEIYSGLTLESRKSVLMNYIETNIELIQSGDKITEETFAKAFKVKPNSVVNILSEMAERLKNGTEEDYTEIYNQVGNHSQLKDLQYYYGLITNLMQQDNNSEIVAQFLQANNLPLDDNPDTVVNKLNEINTKIEALNNFVNQCKNIATIKTPEGETIFSPDPKDIIMRILENDGVVASYKGLKALQTHLDNIKKDHSTDEFTSRQGKLKDKSLYNFSALEKETLKGIEKNINPMYSYVQKEITSLRKDMAEHLEELKRYIGVNNGTYWVHQEGNSGMTNDQEVKVLEYMTGRPHYATDDYREIIEKIKTTPYSGISGSSVFHDKIGLHAQYIADIAPVKVKVKNADGTISEVEKEVLFHDNTWGASEHENVWVDSMGLTRTDYSDHRGGTLGYIVNDMYRNGNLVERINGDMILREVPEKVNSKLYKKIKPVDDNYVYSTPQYYDAILDGKAPDLKSIADKIHDTLFIPSTNYMARLQLLANDMTEEEVKHAIDNIKTAGNGWKPKYEEIKARIFNESNFGKHINTKEDYDSLANDDYLKVVLEKIALNKNYQIAGSETKIARVKNVKELAPFKKEQRRRAIRSFMYAFGKNPMIVSYMADTLTSKECDDLIDIKNSYGFDMDDDKFIDLLESFAMSDKGKYNGSLKQTINLVLQQIDIDLAKSIDNEALRNDIVNYLKNFLEEKTYFNEEDLNNPKLKHLIKFIDREFNPQDNAEFVKIFRNLQDMTEEEFKKNIFPKVKREDLGIKNLTGYDILKRLQRYEDKANRDLMNEIYFDTIVPNLNSIENDIVYKYRKFTRDARYMPILNFNTSYRDLEYDLELLTYSKLFNKHKDEGIKKYGAYPAYPKLDYATDELYEKNYKPFVDTINSSIELINGIRGQRENYEIIHKLQGYMQRLDDDVILSDYQYRNINKLLGRFVTINFGDNDISEALYATYDAMNLKKGTPFGEYRPSLEKVYRIISRYEQTSPTSTLDTVEKQQFKKITALTDILLMTHIQERYQNDVRSDINALIKATANRAKNVDELKTKLFEKFKKYHILNNPEELLKTFVKSCTKDSEYASVNANLFQLLQRATGFATLANVQDILMEAISDGTAMDAKSLFNSISVKLSTGDLLPMSSGEIIKQMAHSLILDGQKDTAIMFLDKLGLNEEYVEYTSNDINFDDIKKSIDTTVKLTNSYGAFKQDLALLAKQAQEELNNRGDYIRIIDTLKRKIADSGRKHELEKDVIKLWMNSLDQVKGLCDKNPEGEAWLIFKSQMPGIEGQSDKTVQDKIDFYNSFLISAQTIIENVNEILISPDSKADIARKEMNKKYQDIINYVETVQVNLPPEE